MQHLFDGPSLLMKPCRWHRQGAAVSAYINVALLMDPVLAGLGLSIFTAHMFTFYFTIASAHTAAVALTALAAATITKAEPMATGFSVARSGIVMCVIPFVFALNPELLIEATVIDPASTAGAESIHLPGYDGKVDWMPLSALILRLILPLYLLTSALACYDRRS